MTNYSTEIIDCLAIWIEKLQNCNGDPEYIKEHGHELRKNLDKVFPPSSKIEFESDKINYIFSTIFFLSNRLNKTLIGLAEIDKVTNNFGREGQNTINAHFNEKDIKEFQTILNRILSDYY